MSQQSSPPIGEYLRTKWRGFLHVIKRLTWSDWLLIAIGFIPFFQSVAENIKNKTTWLIVRESLLIFVICIPTFLVFITSKRNLENYRSGLLKGRKQAFKAWGLAQRGLASGLAYAHGIQRQTTLVDKRSNAILAVRELLVSVRKTIVATFDDVDEDQLVVTLGVPNGLRDALTIVEMTPELDNREKGHVYPVPDDVQQCHSMTQCFRTKIASYTPDTGAHDELRGKSYKAILNFPVLNTENECIAVVNVDGPTVDMFVSSAHAEERGGPLQVVSYLVRPALSGIALAIEGAALYKEVRR